MTTLTNIQNEQLFTDLNPEEASTAKGGVFLFEQSINFDQIQYSRTFANSVGSRIQTNISTRTGGRNNPYNNNYSVTLQRNGVDLRTRTHPINSSYAVVWEGLRIGGGLRLKFTDDSRADGERIVGTVKVYD